MATIMPEGDAVKKAINWISENRQAHPETPVHQWVEQAGLRFNLTPKEQEFLHRFCREE